MHIREKPELGWRIKTRRERSIPLVEHLVDVLRRVVGKRSAGPVFLREKFNVASGGLAAADREALARALAQRIDKAEHQAGQPLSREQRDKVAGAYGETRGAVKADQIRLSFIRIAGAAGLAQATCPKSWRHSFATLLQDANVDPLIRQITLGHAPTGTIEGALGMTTVYTHTRPETQRKEILRACGCGQVAGGFPKIYAKHHGRVNGSIASDRYNAILTEDLAESCVGSTPTLSASMPWTAACG